MHSSPTDRYVLGFEEVDRGHVALVGGKAAHLGELSRIEGICVPAGFCVTTDAYRRSTAAARLDADLDRLDELDPDDRAGIRDLSTEVRRRIEAVAVPEEVAAAIGDALARLGDHGSYAVRSSATAEDLPTTSFAGLHDSYLDLAGAEAVVEHVRRCWASLFTERAVAYRLRNGLGHRGARMPVVVQRMVAADVSGVVFTADPVTSNRKVVSIEAASGLGEALVAGAVDADAYRVRDGEVVGRTVRQAEPTMTDSQVLQLASVARRIEAHFGSPQDIEWCRMGEELQIVQSRPITTLFPVPDAGDDEPHVYVSVGHQQMMTDPMKPLGLSVWQLTALRPMHVAGGRLFVDVAAELAAPASRARVLEMMGRSDPLTRDALEVVLERGDFPAMPGEPVAAPVGGAPPAPEIDPSLVTLLMERTQTSLAALEREIRTVSGPALFDLILADIEELRRLLVDPQSFQVLMAGMGAAWWLGDHLGEWLDEPKAIDTLVRSVPGNVTAEMGLGLLDVADAIRPHPEVVAFLRGVDDEHFLEELAALPGGHEARDAIDDYLDRYGMRCVGEIDVTRPRWREQPTALLPVILANVDAFEPGERERRVEQGRRAASEKEVEVLARLRALPDGEQKADETKRMIDRLRAFSGYREFPKFGMVSRYFLYRQALLREGERLARAGVVHERDDVSFLTFDELRAVARAGEVDDELIRRRKEEFRSYGALRPPRVITSSGETANGTYRRDDVPAGALVGLAVSSGTVEGRARVITEMSAADVEPGDILVTTHTDPSWSPLFVAVSGLVTEVGGLMTHGAVIAREYGLPAVVGVEGATQRIGDGQRIRVDGARGLVEIVSEG